MEAEDEAGKDEEEADEEDKAKDESEEEQDEGQKRTKKDIVHILFRLIESTKVIFFSYS